MRFGYFALALTLAASALTAEAWSPPYQTHRLYYSSQYGLRSPTSMSLDNSDAFTIRITGLKMDWNFREYGNIFRMFYEACGVPGSIFPMFYVSFGDLSCIFPVFYKLLASVGCPSLSLGWAALASSRAALLLGSEP